MNTEIQKIKQRFEIIGNNKLLNRAIDIAMQVAHTDLTVMINGESGTGKESFSKIIHSLSKNKHGKFIAINCGAIPEGTIDSELFGHEKGSFTGAEELRKGYFEEANNGTIFLDEIGEMPHSTQARLLRLLEQKEFIRVGSSSIHKTNVRVIAATNVNLLEAVQKKKFREDLYYRLNTVPIYVPPLRERRDDIILLFKKFALDFSKQYNTPPIRLEKEAEKLIVDYNFPGNIRELKNLTYQISVLEQNKSISKTILLKYLPNSDPIKVPAVKGISELKTLEKWPEKEIMYKVLFEMKQEINFLKSMIVEILSKTGISIESISNKDIELFTSKLIPLDYKPKKDDAMIKNEDEKLKTNSDEESDIDKFENLSLEDVEKELIKKALDKHSNKRKLAADELGISERTLYRKIKSYKLDE